MGLYDKQIRERAKADQEAFQNSFIDLSSAVMGDAPELELTEKTRSALLDIIQYYHIKPPKLNSEPEDENAAMEALLRPVGLQRRTVKLTGAWYKDAMGPMLGTLKEGGESVALLPRPFGGYAYFDYATNQKVNLNKKTAAALSEDALCFYKPLPQRPLKARDIIIHIISSFSVWDFVVYGITMLIAAVIGLVSPMITNAIFGTPMAQGNTSILLPAGVVLVSTGVASLLISSAGSFATWRIESKASTSLAAAIMLRLLSLNPAFFRRQSSGELAERSQAAHGLPSMIISSLFSSNLTAVFSLVYLGQIMTFAPALLIPAMVILAATIAVSVLSALTQYRHSKKTMEISAKESGLVYALFSGVQKLKLAGAERRAFAKWAKSHSAKARLLYSPPALVVFSGVLSMLVSSLGLIWLYASAAASHVSSADYLAFSAAYGLTSGAFLSLTGAALSVGSMKNIFHMLKPIMDETPEADEARAPVKVTGDVELSEVSFSYGGPPILDRLSLHVRPGQYLAIAGRTGCGKSTLLRLLLGFEKPAAGAVYYGGADLSGLDVKALRRGIGVVMQDGALFTGSVFDNIAIAAPGLTLEGAWEAAEISGIADDIRAMPMGMHTMISAGGGGVSGGQKQRLMIARAVASKPKLLILDEATSALDNITQKRIADALDELRCTRIVVAHRLSTIRHCDRIVVLENGRIAEDGSYDSLVAQDGLFAELVRRQLLDG
jgi:NHLM bacteriocin system ABC transporter ATP-binding protein